MWTTEAVDYTRFLGVATVTVWSGQHTHYDLMQNKPLLNEKLNVILKDPDHLKKKQKKNTAKLIFHVMPKHSKL